MGTNCAPLLANLFLFDYENRFMQKLTENKLEEAKMFQNTFRFIYQLITNTGRNILQNLLNRGYLPFLFNPQ